MTDLISAFYRPIRALIAAFGLVVMLAAPVGAETTASSEEAEKFIHELGANAVAMVDNHDQTDAEREAKFRRIVSDGFALEVIGRFVVGRYWRQMSPDQQREYQTLFAEWLMETYAGRLGGYEGQKLEVVNSVTAGSRDIFVRTHVLLPDGSPPMSADWRVRKFGDRFRIIDIVVEGVSMAAAQKSEFESVIRKVGVEGLIESLRQRLTMMLANTG